MHLPTVPYSQFAGNNLVQNADQILHSHVKNFIRSRSAFKRGGGWGRQKTGYRWTVVAVAQTKQPYLKEDDWLALSSEKLGS